MPNLNSRIIRYSNGAVVDENAHGVFHAVLTEAPAVVEADGFLNEVAGKFKDGTGDIIHAVMNVNAAPVFKAYAVTRVGDTITLIGLTTA